MGKAIAVLLLGLGLALAAVLLALRADSSRDVRGSTAGEPAHAAADAPEVRDVELVEVRRDAVDDERRATLAIQAANEALDDRAKRAIAMREGHEPPLPRVEEIGTTARAYYANGQLEYECSRMPLDDGSWVLSGPWRSWYENGQAEELGAYRDSKEIGPWEWWYENGERMAVGQFVDGMRDGFWRYWHENGALMTECTYKDGKAHGLWSQYHPNGFKTAQGNFENGELKGEWLVWNEDGTLNLDGTGVYASGEKVE